jgi:hypothetical protein
VQKKLHTQTLIGRLVQKILQYFSRVLSESFHKHFGKILSAASHTNGSQTINLIQKTYLHRHLKKFRCLCKFGIIVDISGSWKVFTLLFSYLGFIRYLVCELV